MSSIKDNRWDCTSCGVNQGPNDIWHEGDECGDCNSQRLGTEKKDEIESMLIDMWAKIPIDIPDNYEDIVQWCYEDVCDTADEVNWNHGDVMTAFRRWIESK